jgi:hypothetical protein
MNVRESILTAAESQCTDELQCHHLGLIQDLTERAARLLKIAIHRSTLSSLIAGGDNVKGITSLASGCSKQLLEPVCSSNQTCDSARGIEKPPDHRKTSPACTAFDRKYESGDTRSSFNVAAISDVRGNTTPPVSPHLTPSHIGPASLRGGLRKAIIGEKLVSSGAGCVAQAQAPQSHCLPQISPAPVPLESTNAKKVVYRDMLDAVRSSSKSLDKGLPLANPVVRIE